MSRTRKYHSDTIAVMTRFFSAMEFLKSNKTFRIQDYYDEAGINKIYFYKQKKELTRGYFEIAWVMPLIRNYNISAEWLLLGKGGMFNKDVVSIEE